MQRRKYFISKISNDIGLIENVNKDKVKKFDSELVKNPSPLFKEEEISK